MDADQLKAAIRLVDPAFCAHVVALATTESTNDDAKALARAGAASGSFVVAGGQSRGRGRGANVWHSPSGTNLYLSVVLRPALEAAAAPGFALAVGCVVAAAIDRRIAGQTSRIKWPNDVLVEEKKISGVLIEAQVRGDVVSSVVVGIGLNVSQSAFPSELATRATSLALLGAAGSDLDRTTLAAEIAHAVSAACRRYEASGLSTFSDQLHARDALLGTRIQVGDVEGLADGIEPTGQLAIRRDDGQRVLVSSGHVEPGSPPAQPTSDTTGA